MPGSGFPKHCRRTTRRPGACRCPSGCSSGSGSRSASRSPPRTLQDLDRMRSIAAASSVVRRLPHPVEEALLVPAVMIDGIVPEPLDDLRAGLPDGLLLGRVVGPEGVARAAALLDREQADQVVEVPVGHPLDVEVEGDAAGPASAAGRGRRPSSRGGPGPGGRGRACGPLPLSACPGGRAGRCARAERPWRCPGRAASRSPSPRAPGGGSGRPSPPRSPDRRPGTRTRCSARSGSASGGSLARGRPRSVRSTPAPGRPVARS